MELFGRVCTAHHLLLTRFLFVLFGFSFVCLAVTDLESTLAGVGEGLDEYATTRELPQTIGAIIRIVLGFLGIVLLVVIIYGGWLWMTAGGDEEQVKKAKSWIVNGIIGLVIILLAYAITDYVIGELLQAVQST